MVPSPPAASAAMTPPRRPGPGTGGGGGGGGGAPLPSSTPVTSSGRAGGGPPPSAHGHHHHYPMHPPSYDYGDPALSPHPYRGPPPGPPPPHGYGGYRGGMGMPPQPPGTPGGPYSDWGPPPGSSSIYDQPPPSPAGHRGYWPPPPPVSYDYRRGPPPPLGYGHPSSVMRSPHRVGYGAPPNSDPYRDFRPPAPAAPAKKQDTGNAAVPATNDKDHGDDDKKKDGNALSILANVSADMDGDKEKKQQGSGNDDESSGAAEGKDNAAGAAMDQDGRTFTAPAPTSPLQRRTKPSPITPSQTPQENKQRAGAPPSGVATSASGARGGGPPPHHHQQQHGHNPITPITATHSQDSSAPPIPPGWEPPPPEGHHPPPEAYGTSPHSPRRPRPGYPGEFGLPHDSPALVERGSFDSHGREGDAYARGPFAPGTPPTSRGHPFYDDRGDGRGPPPPPHWESDRMGAPYSPYPPPRWNPPPNDIYYHGGPPPPPPGHYPHETPYPPPPLGASSGSFEHEDGPYGRSSYPPLHHYPHHRGPPPPYGGYHHASPPGPHMGMPPPYYMHHHPRVEEKTILRKKFSWKHYPELERFLIANRDEYLKHSNMNYTAEQKAYNNWLTEQLLQIAAQHDYIFDPEDFNFVAIRDRIRCYYKSYVQTARKRGLKLRPGDLDPKKQKTSGSKKTPDQSSNTATGTTSKSKEVSADSL